MADITLRAYVFIDSLQPQLAAFTGLGSRGFPPVKEQACIYIEVAPGIAINRMTDIALKAARVQPAAQVVERTYGMLEVHAFDKGEVHSAGQAAIGHYGLTEKDRLTPYVATCDVVRSIEPMHAQIINRNRYGHMILPGDSLFLFECDPAAYAVLAANEAEKAARIKVLEIVSFGSLGRVYLAGEDRDIDVAVPAAERAINGLAGRAGK